MPVSSLHLALQDFPECYFLHIFVLMVAMNKRVCRKCTGTCSCFALRMYQYLCRNNWQLLCITTYCVQVFIFSADIVLIQGACLLSVTIGNS